MTKFSPEYLKLADSLLQQFAQTQNDDLSAILTKDDLNEFQSQYKGSYPPLKTLCLFMRQVCSEQKSCRHALIEEARDQVAQKCCTSGQEPQNFKLTETKKSAYCKARKRLTESSIKELLTKPTNMTITEQESGPAICETKTIQELMLFGSAPKEEGLESEGKEETSV